MAILVDRETRLVVQGLTGSEGRFHGLRNRSHGTNVVAGVTPGKGGQDVEGIPVFDTVAAAVNETGANTAMVFVPAPFAADAMYEAVDAGIGTVICITEGVPAHEMLRIHAFVQGRGVRLIGPNCPGALSPGQANVGIIPAEIFREGAIGLVSRSGTLTYQIGHELTQLGLGNSTIVGIGGDPIVGSSFLEILALFEGDAQTEQVVMVGEIGGDEEEKAAAFIEAEMTKPVVAYIAGFTAPPGKTMGHAGAIISGSAGTAQAKKDALEARGIRVGTTPTESRAARRRDRAAVGRSGGGASQPRARRDAVRHEGRLHDPRVLPHRAPEPRGGVARPGRVHDAPLPRAQRGDLPVRRRRGELEVDGERRQVGEGDAVLIPSRAWHELTAGESGAGSSAAACPRTPTTTPSSRRLDRVPATPISFARGAPAPELIPAEELADCAHEVARRDGATVFAYGPGGGYAPLREWVADRHDVAVERVVLTVGGLQGFVFYAAEQLARRPGRVLVEAPSYDRPLKVLAREGVEIVALPMDDEGLDPDALDAELRGRRDAASFLYTIPTFQNPSGRSLSPERRARLVEIVREHELPVLEDDPYGLVRFEGDRATEPARRWRAASS